MNVSLLSAALLAALSLPAVAAAGSLADGAQAQPAPAASTATKLGTVEVVHEAARDRGRELALAERRYSGAVSEILSAEAMSRRGDSDAADALKRVTGLTLVDGRYIYVRGLGERYSSVLLNGARIPSPDPTRRVVPMNLFPAAVLESVVVRKSASAEMPGHFGGGTVVLRTRRYPEQFTASFSVNGKFDAAATGDTGFTYAGGARDWTGFDNDARDLPPRLQPGDGRGPIVPSSPLSPDGLDPAQLEQLGEAVAASSSYRLRPGDVGPGGGLSASIGNGWQFADGVRGGFLAAIRYAMMWDHRQAERRSFAATDSGLALADDMHIDRTSQNIELSGFLNAGLDIGKAHHFGFTHMLLRQSEDLVKISEGTDENQQVKRYQLRWLENELRSTQLTGRHQLPHYLELTWQYTDATATREEPDTRRWRRDDDDGDGIYQFSARTDSNSQTTAWLEDNLVDWSAAISMPVDFSPTVWALFSLGHARLTRDREALLRSFAFDGRVDASLLPLEQADALVPSYIGPDGLVLEETTLPSDNYVASQDLRAWYAKADLTLFGDWRLVLGLRHEANHQQVVTGDPNNRRDPLVTARIDRDDWLPSAALTWTVDDNDQWRLAYARTLARPDFRELSPAPFLDPILHLVTVGTPDLQTTSIRNFDLRWEHYFSAASSLSVGAFYKAFDNPIEKTFSVGGSTQFIKLRNALSAEVYGLELDVRHSLGMLDAAAWLDWAPLAWSDYHIGFNYARIRSRVQLDPDATSQTVTGGRPLQGASPWTANLQLGYRAADGSRDWTVLFNAFGERIARAGVAGQPDVYQQPVPSLDFVYHQALGNTASLELKLGNLLNPDVEFTQGDKVTWRYQRGRTVELGFKLRW